MLALHRARARAQRFFFAVLVLVIEIVVLDDRIPTKPTIVPSSSHRSGKRARARARRLPLNFVAGSISDGYTSSRSAWVLKNLGTKDVHQSTRTDVLFQWCRYRACLVDALVIA